MLPAHARLTNSDTFRLVTRKGRRVGRPRLVVHAVTPDQAVPLGLDATAGPRFGFVVSRAVGNSVVRHRVTRRLRHVLRDRMTAVPPGCTMVVRALPSAAHASGAELRGDIDKAMRGLRLPSGDDDHDRTDGAPVANGGAA